MRLKCVLCANLRGVKILNLFGNVVKHYLIDNDLTQKSIADTLNTGRNTINNLLNRDNISLDKMIMIADALDCDLEINLKPRSEKNK